jgi:hypothetical protein
MINNDYVRGYFDAHGRIYLADKKRNHPLWCVELQDKDEAQLDRVYNYLLQQGYRGCRYNFNEKSSQFGPFIRHKIHISQRNSILRFIEEIGSERPEWQERFTLCKQRE